MKGCAGCLITIILIPIVISLAIGLVGWMFMSDFFIFDILMSAFAAVFALGLNIIIWILIAIFVIYVILELFR